MPIESLKAAILERYASIHAFCKDHREVPRASVYLLLSGKYPGNGARQIARIRALLVKQDENNGEENLPAFTPDILYENLQAARCDNCRRLNRRECPACRAQTLRESQGLFNRLAGTIQVGE